MMELNAEAIAAILVAVLSLALEVVPGFTDLWAKVGKEYKSLIVFGGCILIPFAVVGLACLGVSLGYAATCPNPGDPQMWVNTFLLGLGAFVGSQVLFATIGQPLSDRLKE